MRAHALLDRFTLLAAAATLAAHANVKADGFRQRDLHFLLDLICNWIETAFPNGAPAIQRTQIQRYIAELEREGYLRTFRRARKPLHRLTRTGLIELLVKVVHAETYERPEHFFFVHYFIKNYRSKILELVKQEGKQFPYALEVELQSLLDARALVAREKTRVAREIKKIDQRLADADKAGRLTKECLRVGLSFDEIVKRWELECPYGLNSQKPLRELFSEISPDIAQWELETGNSKRRSELWEPSRRMLLAYQDSLQLLT